MVNFNIMILDEKRIAVPVVESASFYQDGWVIVKMIQAENSDSALELYCASFTTDQDPFQVIKPTTNQSVDKGSNFLGALFGSAGASALSSIDAKENNSIHNSNPWESSDISISKGTTSLFDTTDSLIINPSTGLTMINGIGGIDVGGNLFGQENSSSIMDSSFDSMNSSSDCIDCTNSDLN